MHDEGDTNMSQIKGKNLTHVIDDHLNEEMMTTRYDDDNDDDDTSYGPYASFDHSGLLFRLFLTFHYFLFHRLIATF